MGILKSGRDTIQHQTLDMQVYQALRRAILMGHIRGGTRLVQDDLAAEFGTSRISVRDALKKLEADGLVTPDRPGGYHVSTFSVTDVREIYDLRMVLEPHAAELAIVNLTASHLDELAHILERMRSVIDDGHYEEYLYLNRAFHTLLYEPCGNQRLMRMIEGLWLGVSWLTPLLAPAHMHHSFAEHRAIFMAIHEGRVADVQALLRVHIAHAYGVLTQHLKDGART